MFLRCRVRVKDGKEHNYWSIVENRRGSSGQVIQRQVLNLGEINGSQKVAWCRCIEVFEESQGPMVSGGTFSGGRPTPELAQEVVHVCLSELQVKRPRQWGACWLSGELWPQLQLDDFRRERLGVSREGTDWLEVLRYHRWAVADLPRYTQPEKDHQMLVHELHLQLPAQPLPRIVQSERECVAGVKNL